MSRVTYDQVEAETVRQVRAGHDITLYFRFTGALHVYHDGELVLVDEGRSYDVALAKVKSIGMNADPANEPNDTVVDKDVRRGKQHRTKDAVAAKTKAAAKKKKKPAAKKGKKK